MSTYAVSFRFESDATRGERYESFMEAIRKTKTWVETTSFCLVETSETISAFEIRLFLTKFNLTRDTMLVMEVGHSDAIARGKVDYPATLGSLLPKIDIK